MATVELSLFSLDEAPLGSPSPAKGQVMHRIQEVRRLQGMSLRSAARHLGCDIRQVRAQEQATTDLKLSDLYRWQEALDVPVGELLSESAEPLSRPVMQRAQLVRVMKTAAAILETATTPQTQRMAENLVQQLAEIMPELSEVSPWHSVGQRRSNDELGRIAESPISDDTFSQYE